MDIRQYERAKFELADILRTASLSARAAQPENIYPFEDLFARLAEDRFNLVIAGQFSRGKTSLMNAMLNTESLPTGIVPLTSVITTVQYGTIERATLEYEERRLPTEISLDALPKYITQRHNPGNAQRIKLARVELPSEVLKRGFYLVDTPGLGSAVLENTRTTEDFLPEVDALILVTSYDSPLSDQDVRLLHDLGLGGHRVFVVINKQDLVTEDERHEVQNHISAQIRKITENHALEVFSLSARDAIKANRLRDQGRLALSGLSHFMERLTHFLVEEKQTEFLRGMCSRIQEGLSELPDTAKELDRLAALQRQISGAGSSIGPSGRQAGQVVPHFTSCQACIRVERDVRGFLQKYQYRITVDREARLQLADAGGLCPFHIWLYEAIASPHGTCVGFPDTLESLAKRLETGGEDTAAESKAALSGPSTCILCKVQEAATRRAVVEVAQLVVKAAVPASSAFPDVCLPHLRLVANAIPSRTVTRKFILAEVDSLERVAEDMRRYALKRDGTRRAFATHDELNAHLRGLVALGGHRHLNFPVTAG